MSADEKAKLQPPATLVDKLSPRERQIAEAVWAECTDKLIADGLHISQSTLRTHLGRVFIKLHVATRSGVVRQFERWRAVVKNADVQSTDCRAPRRRRKLKAKC